MPFFPCTLARDLVALIFWNTLVHHKHCQLFSSSLRILSSSQIYETKSSLVSVSAHVFFNNEKTCAETENRLDFISSIWDDDHILRLDENN